MSHKSSDDPGRGGHETPAAATPAVSGRDKRWAKRTGSRLGAQIEHPSLSTPLLCTVRDTSSTGARLELAVIRGGAISRDPVPDRFMLCMPSDRLQVDCEVAWRQGNLVGVRYVSPTRRTPRQQVKATEPAKKPQTTLLSLLINPR